MDQSQKKKTSQGPLAKDEKLNLKDLSDQIPPVSDIIKNIENAAKQEVEKPKQKPKGNCCLDLLRDCCMDD